MKHSKREQKPGKEWMKKWFAEGISNTLFVWIYSDYINWCLYEDAPWKDTVKTDLDQTIEDYMIGGFPQFISEMFNANELAVIHSVIQSALAK